MAGGEGEEGGGEEKKLNVCVRTVTGNITRNASIYLEHFRLCADRYFLARFFF